MQAGQLLDELADILSQDTKTDLVKRYLQQIVDDLVGHGWFVLYEPDATYRFFEPLVQLATEEKYAAMRAESVAINDLEHPVSMAYVMRQPQQFELHQRVGSSRAFKRLQGMFLDNPDIIIVPLGIQPEMPPLAILMVCRSQGEKSQSSPLWRQTLHLLAILLDRQREQEDKKRQQHNLRHQLKQASDQSRQQAQIEAVKRRFIGADPASRKVQQGIVNAAQNQLSVLIRGETGCGKDLVAVQIHQLSVDPNTPFVAVNCAAIPADLIEAELFGSRKGAYTGSTESRAGLVENAQGGILFLDEIGDMPQALQAVLLRVLNEKTYRKVGESQERRADFRLICATNAPLEEMVAQGRFRKDLYYRICQLQLNVPALRQHLEDVPELAAHFVKQYSLETGQYYPPLPSRQIRLLKQHDWPGNVRELKNFIFTYLAQASASTEGSAETLKAFLGEWRQPSGSPAVATTDIDNLFGGTDLRQASQLFEKQMIAARLKESGGNRNKAAQSLGIPKRTLAYKCKKLQIDVEDLC